MSEENRSRRQLLDTAAALFYKEGFRAVGVDTLAAESGVGKMTLYRHFPSKDDLIAAYLHESDSGFWAWAEAALAEPAGRPREQLLSFFRALAAQAAQPACYGCPFLNAVVDFPEAGHPAHQIAQAHKQAVRERFGDLALQAGAAAPAALADQLYLLMDGAWMAVRVFGPRGPAGQVAAAAAALITAHLPG